MEGKGGDAPSQLIDAKIWEPPTNPLSMDGLRAGHPVALRRQRDADSFALADARAQGYDLPIKYCVTGFPAMEKARRCEGDRDLACRFYRLSDIERRMIKSHFRIERCLIETGPSVRRRKLCVRNRAVGQLSDLLTSERLHQPAISVAVRCCT